MNISVQSFNSTTFLCVLKVNCDEWSVCFQLSSKLKLKLKLYTYCVLTEIKNRHFKVIWFYIWPIFKQYSSIRITLLITSILLRWIALRVGCLSKKQYLWTRRTQGITWLTVRLTGLREVTHALFFFSSLFAFSRATFFNGRDSVMLSDECVMSDECVSTKLGVTGNFVFSLYLLIITFN